MGRFGCQRPLRVHARVLGPSAEVDCRVQVDQLEHRGPVAEELPSLEGSGETSRSMMLWGSLCDTVAMLAFDHAGEISRLPFTG